jgi:hypothetical protein
VPTVAVLDGAVTTTVMGVDEPPPPPQDTQPTNRATNRNDRLDRLIMTVILTNEDLYDRGQTRHSESC